MNMYRPTAPPSRSSSSTSSPYDKERNDELRRKLECPVCFNTCLPPIYMCVNGHNVCAKCSEQITECAMCRVPGRPAVRNLFAEDMSSQIKLPCENRDEECQGMFTLSELKAHLPICQNQFSYRCHLPEIEHNVEANASHIRGYKQDWRGVQTYNDHVANQSLYNSFDRMTLKKIPPRFLHGFLQTSVSPCEWIGSRAELQMHVESCHREWLTRGNVADMSMLVQDMYSYHAGVQGDTRLLAANGQLFWCFLQYNQEMSAVVGHVTYVGGRNAAGRYRYMMKVASVDGNQRLEFRGKTLELDDDEMQQGDQRKKMFYVFKDSVDAFAFDGTLKCRVEVLEEGKQMYSMLTSELGAPALPVFEDVDFLKLNSK